MKNKRFLTGIASIGLSAMVLIGCDYNGPTADEIADKVLDKGPTTDEIADKVLDKQVGEQHTSAIVSSLVSAGTVETTKAIEAWGQTDAAFIVTVNNADTNQVNLPASTGYKWEGTGNTDIKLILNGSSPYIQISDKQSGITSADFTFTLTKADDSTKTIKGKVTVKAVYDVTTVGVDSYVKSVFENNTGLTGSNVTAAKPLDKWGQTDVAYTITETTGSASITLNNSVSGHKIEWKPSSIPTGVTASSYTGYSSTQYSLTTSSTAVLSVDFNFRITHSTNPNMTISGKITVNLKYTALLLGASGLLRS